MEEMIDMLAILEDDIIDLYNRIIKLTRYKDISLFDSMILESKKQKEIIYQLANKFSRPTFNRTNFKKAHHLIKEALFTGATSHTEDFKVFDSMTTAERNIGMLYKALSKHCEKLSNYYKKVSEAIISISNNEFKHEQVLWDKYKEKYPDFDKDTLIPEDDIDFEEFDF